MVVAGAVARGRKTMMVAKEGGDVADGGGWWRCGDGGQGRW